MNGNFENLYEMLTDYGKSNFYPFHMPGHKRNREYMMSEPISIDITEITGFDNLHHPEDILCREQEFAAELYGALESYFLVNGSTCGILTAVSATVERGKKLLLCRNAHKSVYNAAYLRQLQLLYLKQKQAEIGAEIPVTADEVKKVLQEKEEIGAVLITSPTYEGFVADIAEIAKAVHKKGIPLIVDEAHGAHLGFHNFFPESAVKHGADIVIQSLHKTMPSLTQTAILHIGKEAARYVNISKIRRYLGIYQTSSPSYVLMGSITKCLHGLKSEQFTQYADNLREFYKKCSELENIKLYVLPSGEERKNHFENLVTDRSVKIFGQDYSKLIIYTKNRCMNGAEIFRYLRDIHHLECEMASRDYVLAMTSVADTKTGFNRLLRALKELDKICRGKFGSNETDSEVLSDRIYEKDGKKPDAKKELKGNGIGLNTGGEYPETVFTISEILDLHSDDIEAVAFEESEGLVSAEYIYCYPPGTPIIVPGERIRDMDIRFILNCKERGLNIQGTEDYLLKKIRVLKTEKILNANESSNEVS